MAGVPGWFSSSSSDGVAEVTPATSSAAIPVATVPTPASEAPGPMRPNVDRSRSRSRLRSRPGTSRSSGEDSPRRPSGSIPSIWQQTQQPDPIAGCFWQRTVLNALADSRDVLPPKQARRLRLESFCAGAGGEGLVASAFSLLISKLKIGRCRVRGSILTTLCGLRWSHSTEKHNGKSWKFTRSVGSVLMFWEV
jgi:hypothetical protein